jgi:hypothetical protein
MQWHRSNTNGAGQSQAPIYGAQQQEKTSFLLCVRTVCAGFLLLVGTPTLETNRNECTASKTSNKSTKCNETGWTRVEQARAKSLSMVHKNKKSKLFIVCVNSVWWCLVFGGNWVTPTLETNRTEYAASKTSNKSFKCNGAGRTRVEQARAKYLSVVHKNKKTKLFVVCVDSVCWFLVFGGDTNTRNE